MPILSYLALPQTGGMNQLCADLECVEFCEVVPSLNEEVVILVTDTPNEKAEKTLQKTLKELSSLQSLSMTFGHNAEQ